MRYLYLSLFLVASCTGSESTCPSCKADPPVAKVDQLTSTPPAANVPGIAVAPVPIALSKPVQMYTTVSEVTARNPFYQNNLQSIPVPVRYDLIPPTTAQLAEMYNFVSPAPVRSVAPTPIVAPSMVRYGITRGGG